MKKIIAVLMAVYAVSASAFALDLGAGGTIDYSYVYKFAKFDYTTAAGSSSTDISVRYNMIGFKGFFDARYAVAAVGLSTSVGKTEKTAKNKTISFSAKSDNRYTYFDIGVWGKFPFEAGNITLFPLAGFDFDFIVALEEDGKKVELAGEEKKELNNIWLDLGFGADVPLSFNGKLCVRPQGIFGIKLNRSEHSKKMKDMVKNAGGEYSDGAVKLNIGVALVYKF